MDPLRVGAGGGHERHPSLHALALVCSLTASPEPSSSELAREVLAALEEQGASHEVVRVIDHDVKPGVQVDMGDGDEWPSIREQLLAADILVFATPTRVGHMTSVAQGVLERLDGELSETDDSGRPLITGKVAVVAVVGNEDGAHHISADAFQALADVGFTIPAQGVTYWNGEAMQGVDYLELEETPKPVAEATKTLVENAAHLARLLGGPPAPSYPSGPRRGKGVRQPGARSRRRAPRPAAGSGAAAPPR